MKTLLFIGRTVAQIESGAETFSQEQAQYMRELEAAGWRLATFAEERECFGVDGQNNPKIPCPMDTAYKVYVL